MIFNAVDKNMDNVNKFIHSFIPDDCSAGIINQIDLAVEEIFVNIAHYAYTPKDGDVEIGCSVDDGVLTITFKDFGKAFDPLAKKDPDLTLSAEEREIGGLGIFLTKKFMDRTEYHFTGNQNVLTICKKMK